MDHHQRHIDARAPAAGPRPANAGDRRPATRAAVGALVPWLEAITALAALTGLATSCADEPSDAGGVADGVAASDGAPADSGKTDSGKTDTGGGVACHPVKNDGCPSGQHCVWEGDTITCVDDGEHEAGEACDDGKGCKIGVCVGSQGGEARCSPHCTIGLTCASGICNQLENSKGKVCDMGGDNLIACDPLAQDCKTGGTACYSTPKGFGCLSTGSADVKESCTDDNGCKPGLACIGQSSTQPGQCYKMCRQGGGEPSCDSVTAACSKLLGSNTVGYCDG
jgi:hypothetical protein